MSTIDRASPVPYYEQLYTVLLDRIREGEFTAQDRLPSESELHREFGLSRATVRQALELLGTNGWAVRIPRRGYFASSPPSDRGWMIEGQGSFLEDEVGHRNENVRTDVVRGEYALLPEQAARSLKVGVRTQGFVLERRRYLDHEVVLFSTNYSPPVSAGVVAGAAEVLAGEASLNQALREGGFLAAGSRRVIHALAAPRAIAEHLEVGEGTALLRIQSVTWDANQVPFDYYETWLRSDRMPLELSASAQRQ
jgi:GntR family transcriptional regulator